MKTSEEIRTEQSPFLREIWAAGYDSVREDIVNDVVLLLGDNCKKILNRLDFHEMIYSCKIVTSILIDGSQHWWIKEADGSADKFRNFIKPIREEVGEL